MNRRQHSSHTIISCSVATPRPPAIHRTAACMTPWTCALRGNPILSHYSDALDLRGRASLISDVGGNRRLASSARGLLVSAATQQTASAGGVSKRVSHPSP